MKRINLSIDDELYKILEEKANQKNCTVNVYLINELEKIYKPNPFNYEDALIALENDAKAWPLGVEFTLMQLPSFAKLSLYKAENANINLSGIKARLGKLFNARIREGKVEGVERSIDDATGELKFISRAAVYKRTDSANH